MMWTSWPVASTSKPKLRTMYASSAGSGCKGRLKVSQPWVRLTKRWPALLRASGIFTSGETLDIRPSSGHSRQSQSQAWWVSWSPPKSAPSQRRWCTCQGEPVDHQVVEGLWWRSSSCTAQTHCQTWRAFDQTIQCRPLQALGFHEYGSWSPSKLPKSQLSLLLQLVQHSIASCVADCVLHDVHHSNKSQWRCCQWLHPVGTFLASFARMV